MFFVILEESVRSTAGIAYLATFRRADGSLQDDKA